jgi:hypothetical protein
MSSFQNESFTCHVELISYFLPTDQFVSTNNFALEKPTKQSSDRVEGTRGYSELAVDGDGQTCSQTGKTNNNNKKGVLQNPGNAVHISW